MPLPRQKKSFAEILPRVEKLSLHDHFVKPTNAPSVLGFLVGVDGFPPVRMARDISRDVLFPGRRGGLRLWQNNRV